MKRASVTFLLGVIFLLGLILRLYQHNLTPPGLDWDEVSIGYNAYSILQTGKDEWGKSFPVVFRSLGDYKLPGYIYLTVPFVYFFGLTENAVRLPSIIFGSLTILVLFGLVKKLNLNTRVALLSALLLAIAPWHLQFSRAAFEAVVSLFFILLGVFLFMTSLEGRTKFLLFSLLSFLVAIYTYHSAVVVVPLIAPIIFVTLIIFFWRQIRFRKVVVIVAVFITSVASLPYVKEYLLSPEGRTRAGSENIFQMKGDFLKNFSTNFSGNFSLDFLFFHGDQNGRHSVKKIGELYSWQFVFVLFGLFILLRKKPRAGKLILTFLIVSVLPATLTTVSPHALRSLPAVVPYTLMTAVGLNFIFKKLSRLKLLFMFLLCGIVLYQALGYLHLYYVHARVDYALDWQYGFRETVEFVKLKSPYYDHIYLSPELPPTYLMFYLPLNPALVQASNHNLNHFQNYQYYPQLPNLPDKTSLAEKGLVVLPAGMVNNDVEIMREIKLLNGDPFFKIYDY
jgi:4-amino-4-deoxy-L-arabinose transferase-like glycosyltransferase